MFKALPFCLAYTFPFLVLLSARGGWALLTVPIFTFLFVPVLDIVSGIDPFNPNRETDKQLRDSLFFASSPGFGCLWN